MTGFTHTSLRCLSYESSAHDPLLVFWHSFTRRPLLSVVRISAADVIAWLEANKLKPSWPVHAVPPRLEPKRLTCLVAVSSARWSKSLKADVEPYLLSGRFALRRFEAESRKN